MGITKADTFTPSRKQEIFYSDFPNSFTISPIGNELGRLVNERSVTQSIKNLVRTILGERLYQPNIGCTIYNSNFEMDDKLNDLSIINSVKNTIKTYEPRCNLISVSANSDPDNHTVNVTIVYSLINNLTPITVNIILKRVR